eukprot:Lankesteria_metandrocarpae@DN2187_c0_g1_i1.p1
MTTFAPINVEKDSFDSVMLVDMENIRLGWQRLCGRPFEYENFLWLCKQVLHQFEPLVSQMCCMDMLSQLKMGNARNPAFAGGWRGVTTSMYSSRFDVAQRLSSVNKRLKVVSLNVFMSDPTECLQVRISRLQKRMASRNNNNPTKLDAQIQQAYREKLSLDRMLFRLKESERSCKSVSGGTISDSTESDRTSSTVPCAPSSLNDTASSGASSGATSGAYNGAYDNLFTPSNRTIQTEVDKRTTFAARAVHATSLNATGNVHLNGGFLNNVGLGLVNSSSMPLMALQRDADRYCSIGNQGSNSSSCSADVSALLCRSVHETTECNFPVTKGVATDPYNQATLICCPPDTTAQQINGGNCSSNDLYSSERDGGIMPHRAAFDTSSVLSVQEQNSIRAGVVNSNDASLISRGFGSSSTMHTNDRSRERYANDNNNLHFNGVHSRDMSLNKSNFQQDADMPYALSNSHWVNNDKVVHSNLRIGHSTAEPNFSSSASSLYENNDIITNGAGDGHCTSFNDATTNTGGMNTGMSTGVNNVMNGGMGSGMSSANIDRSELAPVNRLQDTALRFRERDHSQPQHNGISDTATVISDSSPADRRGGVRPTGNNHSTPSTITGTDGAGSELWDKVTIKTYGYKRYARGDIQKMCDVSVGSAATKASFMPNVDVIILFSGDCDFEEAIRECLRTEDVGGVLKFGKHVFVVGFRSAFEVRKRTLSRLQRTSRVPVVMEAKTECQYFVIEEDFPDVYEYIRNFALLQESISVHNASKTNVAGESTTDLRDTQSGNRAAPWKASGEANPVVTDVCDDSAHASQSAPVTAAGTRFRNGSSHVTQEHMNMNSSARSASKRCRRRRRNGVPAAVQREVSVGRDISSESDGGNYDGGLITANDSSDGDDDVVDVTTPTCLTTDDFADEETANASGTSPVTTSAVTLVNSNKGSLDTPAARNIVSPNYMKKRRITRSSSAIGAAAAANAHRKPHSFIRQSGSHRVGKVQVIGTTGVHKCGTAIRSRLLARKAAAMRGKRTGTGSKEVVHILDSDPEDNDSEGFLDCDGTAVIGK